MMHVVSLSFIACLLVVLFRQHAEIRELQSQVQTQVHQHRVLSAEKCPACERCSKTKLDTNGVVVAKNYAGVAVTTFLGAPKWFQNRYTMMVNQVLALVEDDWIVQIVYDPAVKMALEGIAYAGIRRQIARGRVVLTPIPPSMKKIKKNKLLLSSWFWKSLVAENVLLFGGTAALCANTQFEVSNFTSFDYIGAPWNSYQGRGGEGGITIRKRSVMEALTLQFEKDNLSGKSTGTAREDTVIVRSLVDRKARLASKEVCIIVLLLVCGCVQLSVTIMFSNFPILVVVDYFLL